MKIQTPLEEGLLEAVMHKTGQSQDTLMVQIAKIAEQHLKDLLSETENSGMQTIDVETFMRSGNVIAQKHAAAFEKLAQ